MQTLYDKIFNAHIVEEMDDGTCLLYIDRHLVHEVTSPQAFDSLRSNNRPVRRPDCTLATVDHNIPTSSRASYKNVKTFVKETDSRIQCMTLEDNVKEFGLTYFGLDDSRQGIVHVIGPEQGFTLPGTTLVCGDSHTATHGAFGALAFGIGTTEVEHVLGTQTLLQKKSKNMRISVVGKLNPFITSKDVILHIIGVVGTAGGTGHVIEFAGDVMKTLSMDARMSICNMAIEAGARAGMISPDDVTFEYLNGRPLAPKGDQWDAAVKYWKSLVSDEGAKYDKDIFINATDISPTVTWGTSPQDVVSITGSTPDPSKTPATKSAVERSLAYMGLSPNTPMTQIKIDKVFIGSCTNSRIEDLEAASAVILASPIKKIPEHVYAMVVPGSGLIKLQAEKQGLDVIFKNAGFDWREAGCSMCLGMNPDQLAPGERCASTSNRNFEGRQGAGGRTHLLSPAMAAAAALEGRLADVRVTVGGNINDTLLGMKVAFETIAKTRVDGKKFVELGPEVVSAPKPQRVEDSSKDGVKGTMMPVGIVTGIAAPLPIANVDTDFIIPKQFLKTITRTGLGKSAFFERRYHKDGSENEDFVLNKPVYREGKAVFLVTGENFGCGSSREHAPWALGDLGIRVIIATSFADIFFNNCFKNGMLPVVLLQAEVDVLMEDANGLLPLSLDLPNQTITRQNGQVISFEVEEFRKYCLVNGLDDIGLTMKKKDLISAFEKTRSSQWPWLDGVGYDGKVVATGVKEKVELSW